MSRTRKKLRNGVEIAVDRDTRRGGQAIGSRIVVGGTVYRLPHWPSRIKDVQVADDVGGLIVCFANGSRRLLTLHDAEEPPDGRQAEHRDP